MPTPLKSRVLVAVPLLSTLVAFSAMAQEVEQVVVTGQ
jgi:hypothetical protein